MDCVASVVDDAFVLLDDRIADLQAVEHALDRLRDCRVASERQSREPPGGSLRVDEYHADSSVKQHPGELDAARSCEQPGNLLFGVDVGDASHPDRAFDSLAGRKELDCHVLHGLNHDSPHPFLRV